MANPNPFTPEEVAQILEAFFATVGTRQYVGARYVPIFGRRGESSIVWNNFAPYEPLTIVLYQGNSYTSRQYVPEGVAITNQEYWAQTGNFNAQVEQYKQQVLLFSSRIDQNASAIAAETTERENADNAIKSYVNAQIDDKCVPYPDGIHYSKYGTLNQVLATLANGDTKWVDPITPTDQQAETYISAWLNAHPEATTTVQDGAITTQKLANGAVTDAKLANPVMSYKGQVSANTDLNDYQTTGIYLLNLSTSDYNTLRNAPDISMIGSATACFLFVYKSSTTNDRGITLQRIYCGGYSNIGNKNLWVSRYGNYQGEGVPYGWFNWVEEAHTAAYEDNFIRHFLNSGGYGAFADFALTNNSASKQTFYVDGNAGDKISFCIPYAEFDYSGEANLYLQTFRNGTALSYVKVFANPTSDIVGKVWTITLTQKIDRIDVSVNKVAAANINTFNGRLVFQPSYVMQEIESVKQEVEGLNGKRIFRVGPTREFTSLLEGLLEAERYKDSIVYVDAGTYDAVQEFKDHYGATYFTVEGTDYTTQENARGIPLTNGVHVIGFGDVVVTGGLASTDSAKAIEWWSIFNGGDDAHGDNYYGFTLENITLKVLNNNIRYAIHDEYGNTQYEYINKYINCRFVIARQATPRCIGGGLGKHGYIVIDNCTVEAPSYGADLRGINYHNSYSADSMSEVYIKNCYIPNGTVGITWNGQAPATQKSMLYVNNCYLQHEPIKQAENENALYENVDIVSWNNQIAS